MQTVVGSKGVGCGTSLRNGKVSAGVTSVERIVYWNLRSNSMRYRMSLGISFLDNHPGGEALMTFNISHRSLRLVPRSGNCMIYRSTFFAID